MDHCHVLAQQLDCLGKDLFPAVHIVHAQHVDGVQKNLQVVAADLIQHQPGTLCIVNNVPCHRLDRYCHSVLLGAAYHRLQIFDKGDQSLVTAALGAELVLRIGSTGLGAHHTAAQQARKPDMSVVLFLHILYRIRVRMCKVQIVAQHRHVNAVFLKQMAQIQCVARGQGAGIAGILLHCLAEGKVCAGKSLFLYQRKQLLHGQLLCIVKTQTKLDHWMFLLFPVSHAAVPLPHRSRWCR